MVAESMLSSKRKLMAPIAILFVAICVYCIVHNRFVRSVIIKDAIEPYLITVYSQLVIYPEEVEYFRYPPNLDFLNSPKYRNILESYAIKHGRSRNQYREDLSRLEYVWVGSVTQNLNSFYYTPTLRRALVKLYGEFNYPTLAVGENTRDGLPIGEIIFLIYRDDRFLPDVFVCFLDGRVDLLSSVEIDDRIVFQNAFLRLPVREDKVDTLLSGLEHLNSGYRFRSAEALAQMGRPEGEIFLNTKYKSADKYLKIRAADAMARLGKAEAIEYLQEEAELSEDIYIRIFAERTLRELGKWRPTENQYYTDDYWQRWEEKWKRTPLPAFEDELETIRKKDPYFLIDITGG